MKVSVIIPVYNEKEYILKTIKAVKALDFVNLEKEIIVVDDGSDDGTPEILKLEPGIKIILSAKNYGKGHALKIGLAQATGDIIALQDADLEYNPLDLSLSVNQIINNNAQVVFGSRMKGNNPIGHWRYYLGNLLISFLVNLFFDSHLSDIETGHKVFLKSIIKNIDFKEKRFGFEVEITAKILRKKIIVTEVPIGYSPRKFNQGKKIKWLDGLEAIWLIIKYRFIKL